MTILLLAAAAVLCASGLIAVGFGVPIKEFSFGNTLILAGATLVGSGFIVLALAVVAGELRKLTDAPRAAGQIAPSGRRKSTSQSGLPGHPDAPGGAASGEDDTVSPSSSLPSWPPEVAAAIASAAGQSAPGGPPPSRPPFVPEPLPEPKLSFELAWPHPKPGSASGPDNAAEAAAPAAPPAPPRRSELFRRSARASSLTEHPPVDNAAAGLASAAAAPAAPATPVSILKSGVVDGMAYTLFSDGSIETEMADGKVRFASIEALRAHLDQRGT